MQPVDHQQGNRFEERWGREGGGGRMEKENGKDKFRENRKGKGGRIRVKTRRFIQAKNAPFLLHVDTVCTADCLQHFSNK